MLEDLKNARGWWMQHHELYPLIGLKPGQHLPKEGFNHIVGTTLVRCEPATNNGRRSKHRIKVDCPKCGRLIPFGRIGQHLKRRDHR